jgi:hypothetical protein
MAEVTDVNIVAGLPTGGTGTVPTLSKTNTAIGATNETPAANPTATAGLGGVLRGYWTDFKSFIGSLTETAPATDTASSGLNGRTQRIAQRLTSIFGGVGDTTDAMVAAGANGSVVALLKRLTTDQAAAIADTTAINVIPIFSSSGNTSATTAATGTNYTAFGSQACKQLTLENNTGTELEFTYGGTGTSFPVPNGKAFTFFGITNTNALSVRRSDTSNTQVTVKGNWAA